MMFKSKDALLRISKYDQVWRNKQGLHRENSPALIYENGDMIFYKNGLRHRDIGPAHTHSHGCQFFYFNGILIHQRVYDNCLE